MRQGRPLKRVEALHSSSSFLIPRCLDRYPLAAGSQVVCSLGEADMLAKGNVIEARTREEAALFGRKGATKEKLVAYFDLTKPRVTLMVTLTAAAGFYL